MWGHHPQSLDDGWAHHSTCEIRRKRSVFVRPTCYVGAAKATRLGLTAEDNFLLDFVGGRCL
jgi:hypothetical protein